VRIGNGAWDQFQLDTYGELLGAAWFVTGAAGRVPDAHWLRFLADVVEVVIERWEEPDEGIWEIRGGRQHFIFSKLMAWVALDRGIWLVEASGADLGVDLARWHRVREAIRARIEADGVEPQSGAFVMHFGSTTYDAATLLIPSFGFLPYDDPRVVATIRAIEERLTRDGHVYRYLAPDGLLGGEGTFAFCTLWLVAALARSGRVAEAKARLQAVLDHANDLGLLAEEIDVETGEQLGNFPQAFSHVGLINAAQAIRRAEVGTRDPVATA
jgi:GH15 family glucan-1,4-alpha-glucosidase